MTEDQEPEDDFDPNEDLLAPIDEDRDLKEIPVTLDSKTGKKRYVIREISGEVRDQYLNNMNKRVGIKKDGKDEDESEDIKDFTGLIADILTRTMYEKNGSEEVLVDLQTIQSWPSRLQQKLSDRSLKLSGLDKDAEKRAKNSESRAKQESG